MSVYRGCIILYTRQMIIIVGASLSESAQSAKWRENGVPRNCILTTQCSYMDVLSVQHGNAIQPQGAIETDSESGF